MKFSVLRLLAVLSPVLLLLAGCAQPGLSGPKAHEPAAAGGGRPAAIGKPLRLRTTAYTGTRNAIGGRLSHGKVTSAASDWSEFPLGTRFRLCETGKVYEIDDYGSALIGTRTIDLCMPGDRAMHAWGVRWVNIEILQWGSSRRSLEVLLPREHSRNARRMLALLRRQSKGLPTTFRRIKM